MPFWLRVILTVAAMLIASSIASRIWFWAVHSDIPGYLSGAIGGITAVLLWEVLQGWRRK